MKPKDLKELALQIQSFCQAFLEDKINSREFKTMLMTLSFTAAGVSDDEMKAFNTVLAGTLSDEKHRKGGSLRCIQKCHRGYARDCIYPRSRTDLPKDDSRRPQTRLRQLKGR